MALAKRVIPTILVRGKTAYKGERFNSTRSIGSALAIAKVHARRGVDELCILDVAATAEGRGPDLELVHALSEGCFVPITVGGGVRSVDDVHKLLRAGADKVCIGAGAHEIQGLIRMAAERFGGQAIAVSLDVLWPGGCAMYRRDLVGDTDPVSFAQWLESEGAGEILLQSMERDGTLDGYNLDLIREVSATVNIPVIASGGCSGYDDMLAAFKAGADACAAGALFAFTDATPKGAAHFLRNHNVEVRP